VKHESFKKLHLLYQFLIFKANSEKTAKNSRSYFFPDPVVRALMQPHYRLQH